MAVEIHASEVSTYKTCPRFYYYRYVKNLAPKPTDGSAKLFMGKGMHIGIAAYYEGRDPMRAYEDWLAEQTVPFEADDKDVVLVRKMIGAYMDYARQKDVFEVVAVEQRFVVPIYKPDFSDVLDDVYHAGTVDGVVRDEHGHLWLMEHKSCAQFPKGNSLHRREQTGFYALAIQQVLGEPVRGVIYNFIRKQDPSRARTPVIQRFWVPYNEAQLRSFAVRLYNAVVKITGENFYDPSEGMHCDWMCPYTVLCDATDEGIDTEYLEAELFDVKSAHKLFDAAQQTTEAQQFAP